MYTNFADTLPSQKCDADGERISAFYLMTVFTRYLDLPQTAYMNFLTDCRKACRCFPPVGGDQRGRGHRQEMQDKLVILSYDRLMGRRYSSTERDRKIGHPGCIFRGISGILDTKGLGPRKKEIFHGRQKIQRINELARQSRERELTPEEKAEQKALREEYIAAFRSNLKASWTPR